MCRESWRPGWMETSAPSAQPEESARCAGRPGARRRSCCGCCAASQRRDAIATRIKGHLEDAG